MRPLKPNDYPNVDNWNCPQKSKTHSKCVIVTDPSEISTDTADGIALLSTDNNNNDDDKKRVPAFLVGTDDKLLSVEYKTQIYSSVKGFLNNHIDPNNVPINYSSSGETLHENFHNFIKSKYMPLRLCSGHWKANALLIRLYHSWLRTYSDWRTEHQCYWQEEAEMPGDGGWRWGGGWTATKAAESNTKGALITLGYLGLTYSQLVLKTLQMKGKDKV